jgi:hypothetical protein
MTLVIPQMRRFAAGLIAYEASKSKSSPAALPVAFHVCEKLRPHLVTLMGNEGFRAVLARALTLANAEVPWLRGVQVKMDGSLEGLDQLKPKLDVDQLAEGRVILLSQLLGLLMAFVGEKLTLHLVEDVWPEAPLDDLYFGNGAKK